jgi:hypothetical protein
MEAAFDATLVLLFFAIFFSLIAGVEITGCNMNTWIIGTASDCDIVVNEPGVSDYHCRLTQRPSGFSLEDLKSKDGTFVNGERIASICWVSETDSITLGGQTVLAWPGASSPQSAPSAPMAAAAPAAQAPTAPAPREKTRRKKLPLLLAAVGGIGLLAAFGIAAVATNMFSTWGSGDQANTGDRTTAKLDPQNDSGSNQPGDDKQKSAEPKEKTRVGFEMGQIPTDQPIKNIKVTIQVGRSGKPLNEQIDLHFGFGFPLRLYPVGTDSREPSFAAFPQKSSLVPGENSIAEGKSAWFEFNVDPDNNGMDELKTTSTLLQNLTIADIHSIGFASRGESDWVLEGYKIEINGALYASNDAVNAIAWQTQAKNDASMRSQQAAFEAVSLEFNEQKEIVESGLASPEQENELKSSQEQLREITDRLNTSVGLVAGYYPWFQENDAAFKPVPLAATPVKKVVVTLVTSDDEKSGTHNSLYLSAGGKKILLAGGQDFLIADPKREQKFELSAATFKYDPISSDQIKDFEIGMLGSDDPSGQVADRAKLQRVTVEVDGQEAYTSEKKEVDRNTLSEIHLLPPRHRDDLGTPVENTESDRHWFSWKPGKSVAASGGDNAQEEIQEPVGEEKENLFAAKSPESNNNKNIDPFGNSSKNTNPSGNNNNTSPDPAKNMNIKKGMNLAPVRRPGQTPGLSPLAPIIVVVIPPRPLTNVPTGTGKVPPITPTPSTPKQPPNVKNVRIVTSGLLTDGQNITVNWDVDGDTSKIKSYRVQLNPVLPHQGAIFINDVGNKKSNHRSGSTQTVSLPINLATFTGVPEQKKYLYVEPQVTAFDKSGKTINGAADKGPILPVAPSNAVKPSIIGIGPLPSYRWFAAACPGYQVSGDGFGRTPSPPGFNYNAWRNFTFNRQGRCAWRLTNPVTETSFPLKFAKFNNHMAVSAWNARTNIGSGNKDIVLRYDKFPVNINGKMHVVAHIGFINGPSTGANSAQVAARVIVTKPIFFPFFPPAVTPPGATTLTDELARIETNYRININKQNSGGQNNALQLIDIPIRLNAPSAQRYATAVNIAKSNSGITQPGPHLSRTFSSSPGGPVANAFVSVTLMISQNHAGANGKEAIGVFGLRIVPEK